MREYAKKYGGVAFQKARKREEREAKAVLLCYGFSSNSKKKKKKFVCDFCIGASLS